MPIESNLFPQVPFDSSEANIPLPGAQINLAFFVSLSIIPMAKASVLSKSPLKILSM